MPAAAISVEMFSPNSARTMPAPMKKSTTPSAQVSTAVNVSARRLTTTGSTYRTLVARVMAWRKMRLIMRFRNQ
ncbi:hypothetical protein D3C83_158440 [compost metagenome]